jgi:acyl-CoA thioester hydrolase
LPIGSTYIKTDLLNPIHLKNILSDKHTVPVRFSEVDALKIVWHGHFIKYMEDGRESFGNKFNLAYATLYNNGFITPIVNLNIDFKRPLKHGDYAIVETTYIDSPAAKLIFSYKIYRSSDQALSATAETIQVFLDMNGELSITIPPFITEWKRTWGFL